MENYELSALEPTASEVLAAISHEHGSDERLVEKITVEQATPYQYAYRIYFAGDPDYEGGIVTFES